MTIAEKILRAKTDYDEVYAAGQAAGGGGGGVDAGLDLFWETYQQGGARTGYSDHYDGSNWTNETFKPKYTLYATRSGSQFQYSVITNYDALKMVDFSKCTNFNYMFQYAKCTHLGVIDMRKGATTTHESFYGMSELETIDKIILKDDGSQLMSNCFIGCGKLANITFEGVIGYNFAFTPCPNLTRDSLMSIIEHLQDFSGTTTKKTLQLHATAKARITEEDIAIATQKGWTVA